MKFTIYSNELLKVLNITGGVIPQKSTLPILGNLLFELSKNSLKITATDLDISVSVKVNVEGLSDGKIAIPGKRLLETMRSLPSTNVDIEAETNNKKIRIVTENGEYKLTGESFEDYPTVSEVEKFEEINIDKDTLKQLIGKTLFAVSTDELRPAMMGVLLQIRKNEIKSISTDGHRLVKIESKKFSSKVEKDIIIPAKALNLVLKSIDTEEVVISFNDTHTKFKMGNITLISKIIEEKYPNYESVIPTENDKRLVVDKNQLLSTVRRTSLYASSTTHQIRLNIKNDKLTVSAEDIDFGSEAKETIKCEYNSDPMEVGFNSSYIIDILSHMDSEEIVLLFSSPTRACIIQPTIQRENEDLLMLLMPVRLNV